MMILAIRIHGLVEINRDIEEHLSRLRLRRKYSAVLLKNTKENMNLLRHVRDFIAYGVIEEADMEELISKRGQPVANKKIDAKKIVSDLKTKNLIEIDSIKPFFRLHPPRGGIDSKVHFPVRKGVLGDHGDKINLLLRRML